MSCGAVMVRGNPDKLNPPIRSTQEAREKGKIGGKKSGEVRREKKRLRELLELALTMPSMERQGTNADAIVAALIERATKGDVRAYECIRDSVGEKPTDRVDMSSSDGSMATPLKVTVEYVDAPQREDD